MWEEGLSCKHEDLSVTPESTRKLEAVVFSCHSSARDGEVGESLVLAGELDSLA